MDRIRIIPWLASVVLILAACVESTPHPQRADRISAMKSDLRNLASLQEIYYAEHRTYSVDYDAIGFVGSPGVTVNLEVSGDGWQAVARHAAASGVACVLFNGKRRAVFPGLDLPREPEIGEVLCTS
jgi:hypothetical protein